MTTQLQKLTWVFTVCFMLFSAFNVDAQCTFTGLNPNYCVNSPTSALTTTAVGGSFSGPGVVGSTFNPAIAGPGTHTITYGICTPSYAITGGTGTAWYNPVPMPTVTSGPETPTSVTLTDDAVTASALNIGFNFKFFCTNYTQFYISSNGFITFSTSQPNGCCSGQVLPDSNTPNNLITLTWEDFNPGVGGTISYATVGTAPNRVLLVNFNNVPHFGGGGGNMTAQLQLYESTNIIEIHTYSMVTDGGNHTMGIEDASGATAFVVTGRNSTTTWSAVQEMYRFTPLNSCSTTQTTVVYPSSVTVVGNNSICVGSAANLSASSNNSFTWTTGTSGNVISNSVGISVSPTSNQVYSISATNAFGCVANSAITVTVDQTPTITAVSSNTSGGICPGATVALSGGGATSYTWTGPVSITNAVSFTLANTGTFVVSGANACGTNTAAISVSIHPPPTIGAIAATGSICSGNTTTINVTGNSVTNTITSTVSGPAVTNGVGFTPAVTNTYTAKGTSALGCTATAVASVQVIQTPTLAPTSTTLLLCIGNSATLTATGAAGGYTWTQGTTTLGTGSTVVVTPNTTTTFSVTKNSSTCFDTKPITIQVNSLTPVFATASPTLVCASNTVALGAFGGVSYQWYASTAPTTSFSGASNPIVLPAVNTTYTVAASDGTCINTAVVSVATNTNPIVGVVTTATNICLGQSATLTASGANNYTWTSNPVTSTTNGQQLTPSFPAAGAYAFFVTGDNSFSCTTTVQQVIIVNAAPSLTAWATKTLVCSSGVTTLNVSGANSYQWDASANNAITNTTLVNPVSTSVYNVTGTLATTGCSSSTTVQVGVYTPTISIMSPTSTCLGGAMTLTGNVNNPSSGATNSYTWTGPGIPNSLGQSIIVYPTALTVYTLTAKSTTLANGSNLSCTESKTTSVGIFYNPTITVAQSRPFVCKGEPVNLIANGATTFTWNGGAFAGSTITVINNNIGTVSYSVVGTDANGCKNDTIYYLKINGCQGIEQFDQGSDGVRIYPNPSNGQFYIVSDKDMKVQLINELGQTIRHLELQSSNNFQLQVSDLAKGIYFIVDEKNTALTGQKIIVQ